MKRIALLITVTMALAGLLCSCAGRPENATPTGREATLYPSFSGATLPPNIAPLTFMISEEADRYHTEIGLPGKESAITVSSSSAAVCPDIKRWRELLASARGGEIEFRVHTLRDGKWDSYDPVKCRVSDAEIDSCLVYRLLYPGYELWREMGIYQRDLTGYGQTTLIDNADIDRQCVNCHTFAGGSPATMMVHVRGPKGGTIINRDGRVTKVNPNCPEVDNGAAYPSWHPSGKWIAFASNNIQQFFHTSGTKTIEVADLDADMVLYDVDGGRSRRIEPLCDSTRMETFPNWSPDGRYLYFVSAEKPTDKLDLQNIRYGLCRVSFDPETGNFGEAETLYDAPSEGKSVSFPRLSPDGRWMLFTLSDYGNFSIWHPESDLWIMDLRDGSMRAADEVNSDDVDSFHSWSPTGRWMVFSSKRLDGLWARPWIASFNPEDGRFGRPFVLPQEDPLFYDTFMQTYNLPELVSSPVTAAGQITVAAME